MIVDMIVDIFSQGFSVRLQQRNTSALGVIYE